MKMFKRFVIPSIEREEVINEITYQGIVYHCPRCMEEVLWFQSKCNCGQKLKYKPIK